MPSENSTTVLRPGRLPEAGDQRGQRGALDVPVPVAHQLPEGSLHVGVDPDEPAHRCRPAVFAPDRHGRLVDGPAGRLGRRRRRDVGVCVAKRRAHRPVARMDGRLGRRGPLDGRGQARPVGREGLQRLETRVDREDAGVVVRRRAIEVAARRRCRRDRVRLADRRWNTSAITVGLAAAAAGASGPACRDVGWAASTALAPPCPLAPGPVRAQSARPRRCAA